MLGSPPLAPPRALTCKIPAYSLASCLTLHGLTVHIKLLVSQQAARVFITVEAEVEECVNTVFR